MLSPFPFFLLLSTFIHLISAQISFSDPIYSNAFCTPQVLPAGGLEVRCSSPTKGFFIMDPMSHLQATTMIFQIISKSTDIGIGLGQRPDSSCLSSMDPNTGDTWATCNPPLDPTQNQPCNKNKCLFNQLTAYTSSTYASPFVAPFAPSVLQLKPYIYQWKFQPPTCPLSNPTNKCWQITTNQKINPNALVWVASKTYSSNCSPAPYVHDCDSPPNYALYIELEAAGDVTFIFTPSAACSIPNCRSCSDPSICDYCEPNYFVSFSKSTCLYGCPVLSYQSFTHCKCQPNAIPISPTECACNPNRNLQFNMTLQSCECMSGYYPDLGYVPVPIAYGTVPLTGTQNCLPCDASCSTCSGGAANQCQTCYFGYFLTSKNKCEVIPPENPKATEEDYELDSVSKAGNVGKTISNVGLIGSTVASAGSSEAVRTSLVGKMFKYLRYLDISYPENLRNLLHSKPSDFLSAKTGIKIPKSLKDEESYDRAPGVYLRYINLPSSFLVNLWEDLLMLMILSGVALLVYFVDFFINRGIRSTKKKTVIENISGKVNILAQSFLIIYMYKDGGDVIFFQILDFRTTNGYSGAEIMNPFASIIFLMITISFVGFHYFIISRYQSAKSQKNNPKALEEYTTKKGNLQVFWKDYKDNLWTHQSFLLTLVVRDIIYNFMLGLLFEYPLIQTLLFPCYSLIMLSYIFIGRPFKRVLDNIQHFTYEIILLIVYICVMILAIMDSLGSENMTARDNLGTAVIVMNCLFNFTPTAFIVLKVAFLAYEYYQERNMKNKRREPVKREISQMNQSSMRMRELKGRKNLEISQVDLNGGTSQIFYQENSIHMMEKSGIEPSTYGEISPVMNPYYAKEVNAQVPIIDQNHYNSQGIDGGHGTLEKNDDIVSGDVEEGVGKVKGEPMKRRKIKKVRLGS